MIEPSLRSRLDPPLRRRRSVRRWSRLALGWSAAAILTALAWFFQQTLGWNSSLTLPAAALLGLILAIVIARVLPAPPPSPRSVAVDIERQFPQLDGALLTAVQQAGTPTQPLNFFQRQVIQKAIIHSRAHNWSAIVPTSRLLATHAVHLLALGAFLAALTVLRHPSPSPKLSSSLFRSTSGISVSPGNTELERGQPLVVLVQFPDSPPASAEIVLGLDAASERRLPLTRSLSDPVFGASIPDITQDTRYRIDYGNGQSTPSYSITVFEYPQLQRADVDLHFPEYTSLPHRRIEDTRRVTAVQGTELQLQLAFNQPLTRATFLPRDPQHTGPNLNLIPPGASATSGPVTLSHSGTYFLHLENSRGRTNRSPISFVFEVLSNRVPELRLVAPRGDLRPSPLEEIRFDGTVWDDYGVLAHGVGFQRVGEDTQFLTLATNSPANDRHAFSYVLPLEDLHLQPNQLISWFAWADDLGPDGQPRRTTTDLYFAETRPFDEIFRQGDPGAEEQNSESSSPGESSPTQQLVQLQRDIVSATWKLRRQYLRDSPPYRADLEVIQESQRTALERANQASSQNQDPAQEPTWESVLEQMSLAIARLGNAQSNPALLNPALAAEQAAYQALLQLQSRETQVTRSRSRGQGQGQQNPSQRQLDQLDLAEADNRYQTQRQAQAATTPERREQLQVLNRLQELARRQEDINQRLQELQTALQQARSPAEREEVQRQLKRLEDEQRQMLSDLDELEERTQRPENQAQFADARQRLEETRRDLERSRNATAQGEVSQALADGTRAQQELQSLRDEVRRQSSSELAEELRQLRADARDTERQQEALARELAAEAPANPRSLAPNELPPDLSNRVAQQQERTSNVVARASQLSEAAEASEPLVSQQLYDALRNLNQQEARAVEQLQQDLADRGRLTQSLYDQFRETPEDPNTRSLQATAELLREGLRTEAAETARRTQANLDNLRRSVEQASERVLGDDTAALRRARDELEALSSELAQEIAQSDRSDRSDPSDPSDPSDQSDPSDPSDTPTPRDLAGLDLDALLPTPTPGSGPASAASGSGPLTSAESFSTWSDRLREVEEMIDLPDLRNDVATARERARQTRIEQRRDLRKPDWAQVRLDILGPLVEVRRQLDDELARRASDNPLLPIDRDPVPQRYSELVRRYYEQLGRER